MLYSAVSEAAAVPDQLKGQQKVKAALEEEAVLWVGWVSDWKVDANFGAVAQMVWQEV